MMVVISFMSQSQETGKKGKEKEYQDRARLIMSEG